MHRLIRIMISLFVGFSVLFGATYFEGNYLYVIPILGLYSLSTNLLLAHRDAIPWNVDSDATDVITAGLGAGILSFSISVLGMTSVLAAVTGFGMCLLGGGLALADFDKELQETPVNTDEEHPSLD